MWLLDGATARVDPQTRGFKPSPAPLKKMPRWVESGWVFFRSTRAVARVFIARATALNMGVERWIDDVCFYRPSQSSISVLVINTPAGGASCHSSWNFILSVLWNWNHWTITWVIAWVIIWKGWWVCPSIWISYCKHHSSIGLLQQLHQTGYCRLPPRTSSLNVSWTPFSSCYETILFGWNELGKTKYETRDEWQMNAWEMNVKNYEKQAKHWRHK
jgi:hypothetical protein